MTPEQARNLINNFCNEYCGGQQEYEVNGRLVSSADLTDDEAVKAANGVILLMQNFAIEEAKGATKQ